MRYLNRLYRHLIDGGIQPFHVRLSCIRADLEWMDRRVVQVLNSGTRFPRAQNQVDYEVLPSGSFASAYDSWWKTGLRRAGL